METKLYNQKGKEAGSISIPKEVFGLPWNADLVHQVVTSMESSARSGTAHTKDRREVRGGGRKPWKQKGTGRARHGSIRSPLWRGGGITHGPRSERNYTKKVNKKMKTKALFTLLSGKQREGKIIFVDSLALSSEKTKEAFAFLRALSSIPSYKTLVYKKKMNASVIVPEKKGLTRSFKNIPQAELVSVADLNPLNVKNSRYVVIVRPEEVLVSMLKKIS